MTHLYNEKINVVFFSESDEFILEMDVTWNYTSQLEKKVFFLESGEFMREMNITWYYMSMNQCVHRTEK